MNWARRSWLRFAMTCVYLCGYLLTFAHFAEERHGVCHEHDAAHHIAETDAAHHHSETDEPRLHNGAKAEDDHCSLFQFFRSNNHTDVADATSVAEPVDEVAPQPAPLGRTSRIDAKSAVWRYAPKTSPPAAA